MQRNDGYAVDGTCLRQLERVLADVYLGGHDAPSRLALVPDGQARRGSHLLIPSMIIRICFSVRSMRSFSF